MDVKGSKCKAFTGAAKLDGLCETTAGKVPVVVMELSGGMKTHGPAKEDDDQSKLVKVCRQVIAQSPDLALSGKQCNRIFCVQPYSKYNINYASSLL